VLSNNVLFISLKSIKTGTFVCTVQYVPHLLNPYKLEVHTHIKKFWEEPIVYFYLIGHGKHRKLRAQQFFYSCVCIRFYGKVFTEPFPSNGRGIHIQTDESNLRGKPLR
jgi:hypothetical protein